MLVYACPHSPLAPRPALPAARQGAQPSLTQLDTTLRTSYSLCPDRVATQSPATQTMICRCCHCCWALCWALSFVEVHMSRLAVTRNACFVRGRAPAQRRTGWPGIVQGDNAWESRAQDNESSPFGDVLALPSALRCTTMRVHLHVATATVHAEFPYQDRLKCTRWDSPHYSGPWVRPQGIPDVRMEKGCTHGSFPIGLISHWARF